MQLLNQEVQAFAQFAAAGKQTVDFIEVRCQASDLFCHINPDGKGGGLGQRPILSSFRKHGAASQHQGLFPAFQETVFLLLDQLGNHGHCRFGQSPQLSSTVEQHEGQTGAFPLARRHQLFQGLSGQLEQFLAVVMRFFVLVGCNAQDIGHAERRGLR